MNIIKRGEKAEKRPVVVDVESRVATVVHTWKPEKDSDVRYELTFKYDYSAVDDEAIWRLATLWVNKDFQNRMRMAKFSEAGLEELESKPIDVAEMYAKKSRAPVDPKAQFEKIAKSMSKEELKAVLEALTADAEVEEAEIS